MDMPDQNLIIIEGQEGAGKSTTVRALTAAIPWSARIDAEDVGDVNPWQMDDAFLHLLWKNVADLTRNFWNAGYRNVIAGSFLTNVNEYRTFRDELDAPANVYFIQLCASKASRDVRRINREKVSSEEWRDMVDRVDPEDTTFAAENADYQFIRIDNDDLTVSDTIERIRQWAPELFADGQ